MIYINPYLSVPINTIIGGVAGTISTKAALATKLGISDSIIKRFEIVGSDVRAHISSTYSISQNCFLNDLSITSYHDLGDKCIHIDRYAFQNCTNLTYARFISISSLRQSSFQNCPLNLGFDAPNIISSESASLNGCQMPTYTFENNFTGSSGSVFIGNNNVKDINLSKITGFAIEFNNMSNLKNLILPLASSISNTSTNALNNLTSCELISMRKMKTFINYGNNGFFSNLKLGCTIEVHIFLATANAGAPAQQLVRAKTTRGAIVKFYDDNGNYISTL